MTHIVVIGSGPAGVSVAKALLERNCHVTLLDAGKTLEPERQQLLNRVKQDPSFLKYNKHLFQQDPDAKKKVKLSCGSAFVYEAVRDFFHYKTQDCDFHPSFAQGGLSHVWGSVVAEYTQDVLQDWPSPCQNLSPYYRAIISWLNAFYIPDSGEFLSEQAKYLKSIWQKNKNALQENHIAFYPVSLAANLKKCVYCGLCQYGCPHALIYCAATHLNELMQNPNFLYRSGIVIEHIAENAVSVTLTATNMTSHQKEYITTDRVFVACGAGLSSMLYLRSAPTISAITLKDSQHFLLPCFMRKKINHIAQYPSHALCQLTLNVHEKNISQNPIYLQLYTYMDLYERTIQKKLKFLYPALRFLLCDIMDRLIVFQGYLHPNDSAKLIIQRDKLEQFYISVEKKPRTQRVFSQVMRFLKKQSGYLDLKIYRLLAARSLAGHSNHFFGSLPMTDNPSVNQSDIFGRPYGWNHVHFVDSSVLPSMPAGPVTLTVMANAYRIGKKCIL